MLRNDAAEIKEIIKSDTDQILDEIRRLQLRNTSGFMLERYLENLSSYTGTVCGTVADDDELDLLEMEEDMRTVPDLVSPVFELVGDSFGDKPATSRPTKLPLPKEAVGDPRPSLTPYPMGHESFSQTIGDIKSTPNYSPIVSLAPRCRWKLFWQKRTWVTAIPFRYTKNIKRP